MTDSDDDKLLQAARRLNTGIAPQRDLWPDIARAMQAPQRSWWTPLLAQAAAVVLLVGGSSAITYIAVKQPQVPDRQVAPALVFEQVSFGTGYELGDEFVAARNALIKELDVELERLAPTPRAEIQANIAMIQEAIYEINAALEQEPNNTLLQQQLLSAYREELTLLRRVGGLTRDIMMRNDI